MDRRLWPEGCVNPSVLLSGSFLGIGSLFFFFETLHGVRGLCAVVRDSRIFFLIFFYFCTKSGKNWPKIGFIGFIGKFSHCIFLNLVYKEISYYLLYSCTNPMLGKNLVPEIWAKMLSANQIAGFLNWLYLQKIEMKSPDCLHVDTD